MRLFHTSLVYIGRRIRDIIDILFVSALYVYSTSVQPKTDRLTSRLAENLRKFHAIEKCLISGWCNLTIQKIYFFKSAACVNIFTRKICSKISKILLDLFHLYEKSRSLSEKNRFKCLQAWCKFERNGCNENITFARYGHYDCFYGHFHPWKIR